MIVIGLKMRVIKVINALVGIGLLGLMMLEACFASVEKLESQDWYEARSPNFHVISDSSEKKTKLMAENLELFRYAVSGFLKIKGEAIKPTVVFALQDMHLLSDAS